MFTATPPFSPFLDGPIREYGRQLQRSARTKWENGFSQAYIQSQLTVSFPEHTFYVMLNGVC